MKTLIGLIVTGMLVWADTSGLYGTYCSYSGSSGSYSSYSSSQWAQFDGQGNFTYGSSGSYSGGGDMYHNSGADGQGRYAVQGNTIILQYSDGSSEQAQVYVRQTNGSITEVMYQGTLYAKSLCQ